MENIQSKESLPYWFETEEYKQFSKLAHNNFGGKPSMENRITRLDDDKSQEARINYIQADLINKANEADSRVTIELLKEDATNCGLFGLVDQIEDIWLDTQCEMEKDRSLEYFDKFAFAGFGLLSIFVLCLFLSL